VTRILLVRHGKTEWNAVGRVQGWTDVPLSPRGVTQAQALGGRLRETPLTAVYASDLSRAAETAEIASAGRGLTVQRLPELREKGFGDWEGLTQTELERDYSELWHRYHTRHELDTTIPGGETYSQVYDRLRSALSFILTAHPGADETVLVAGHGGSARAFILDALQAPLSTLLRLHLDNASLSRLDFRGLTEGRVVFLNDTSHLAGLSE